MSNNAIPFIMQGSNIVLFIDNKPHTINKDSHPRYLKIADALRDQDWDTVRELVDVAGALRNYVSGKLEIKDGEVFWGGRLFHNALSKRMMKMFEEGFPVDPLIKFMDNLMENPSYRAVDELYGFLEHNELPITPDGHFLAYKRVKYAGEHNTAFGNEDLVDYYSGTIRNNVGDSPEMQRNEVNDDKDQTCSAGLHFAAMSYLNDSGYGGRNNPVMIISINPKDVVSIPSDYNNQKGRCCKYTVVDFHGDSDRTAPLEDASKPVVSIAKAASPAASDTSMINIAKHVQSLLSNLGGNFDRMRARTAQYTHRYNHNGDVCYFQSCDAGQRTIDAINADIAHDKFKVLLDGTNLFIVKL